MESALDLPLASRTMLIGTSGSGKTTVKDEIVKLHLSRYPAVKTLMLDSKPRYRAEFELDGISCKVSRRYKKWHKSFGQLIPGSYVLPLKNVKAELKQIWRLGGRIAIAQGEREDWPKLVGAAEEFYRDAYGRDQRLLDVNELADFYQMGKINDIFWLVARSGREKGVGLVAESQRPRYIPVTVLTEMKQVFLFELDNVDDMKRMYDMGIPKGVAPVTREHIFFHWNKKLKWAAPSGQYYILRL